MVSEENRAFLGIKKKYLRGVAWTSFNFEPAHCFANTVANCYYYYYYYFLPICISVTFNRGKTELSDFRWMFPHSGDIIVEIRLHVKELQNVETHTSPEI